MSESSIFEGGCLCGAVRYRATSAPIRGVICHCPMHEEVLADRVQIVAGSLDEPQRMRIDDHVWTQHQLPWLQIDDRLPRYAASSAAVPTKAAEE